MYLPEKSDNAGLLSPVSEDKLSQDVSSEKSDNAGVLSQVSEDKVSQDVSSEKSDNAGVLSQVSEDKVSQDVSSEKSDNTVVEDKVPEYIVICSDISSQEEISDNLETTDTTNVTSEDKLFIPVSKDSSVVTDPLAPLQPSGPFTAFF